MQDGKASDFGHARGWGNPVDIQLSPRGSIAYLAFGAKSLNEIEYVGGAGGGLGAGIWVAIGVGATLALAIIGWLGLRLRKPPDAQDQARSASA